MTLIEVATAKHDALLGLSEALEFGPTRVLRVDGLDHIYAGEFVVTADVNGNVRCKGYTVTSTHRDLAYDVIRSHRKR